MSKKPDISYRKYSLIVEWQEDDKCFTATIPELDDLTTHGDTIGEAIIELGIVFDDYLDIYYDKDL